MTAVAPASAYVFGDQLAVNAHGAAVVGWFGGSRAPVSAETGVLPGWSGSTVEVASGSVEGGLGRPTVLSRHGSDGGSGPSSLSVAISGAGTEYVAWTDYPSQTPMIAVAARGGAFSSPRPFLPGDASAYLGLLGSRDGPVAAVWYAGAELQYALLGADGILGRIVTVGPLGLELDWTPFALNDAGDFVAVGVNASRSEPVVSLCGADARCSPPATLHLGPDVANSLDSYSVALCDDGTAAVLAGFSKAPQGGRNEPLGLWAALRRPGHDWHLTPELAPVGDDPAATCDGRSSVVTALATRRAVGLGLAIARLTGAADAFTRPTTVPGVRVDYGPTIAANSKGRLLVDWYSAARIGMNGRLGGARPLALADNSGEAYPPPSTIAVDAAGNAIAIWNGWGENEERGLYAAIYR